MSNKAYIVKISKATGNEYLAHWTEETGNNKTATNRYGWVVNFLSAHMFHSEDNAVSALTWCAGEKGIITSHHTYEIVEVTFTEKTVSKLKLEPQKMVKID